MKKQVENDSDDKLELISEIEIAGKKCEELKEPEKIIYKTILKSLSFLIAEGMLPKEDEDVKISDNIGCTEKLCNALNVSAEDLENVFNIGNKKLELNATFYKDKWLQQHFKSAICTLTALNICFDIKELDSNELLELLQDLDMDSMQNFSTNLQKPQFKPYIKVTGKKGNPKIYKIKPFGIKEGIKLLKQLIAQEKGESNE